MTPKVVEIPRVTLNAHDRLHVAPLPSSDVRGDFNRIRHFSVRRAVDHTVRDAVE